MALTRAPRRQRGIQEHVAKADKGRPKQETKQPMQAGARKYPTPPLPKQHQSKPGSEATLDPAPLYDAPFYLGSRKLDKKVALITGGDSGIGRAEGQRCLLIAEDVSSQKFCDKAVAQPVKEFGRLDVLVNNAAFQVHTSRFEDLTAEHFDETLKTNLYGYLYMAQAAVKYRRQGSAIINTGSVTGLLGTMKRPAQPEEIAPAYVFLASPQCSSYREVLPIIGGYSGG